MKKLPLGKQHFRQFTEQNLIYVDKTETIYQLISEPNYYFFTRPRRFGKSLTVDVLKNIYEGNQELFKGCWIYDKIAWEARPVVHLDFSNLDFYTKSLSEAITNKLDEIGHLYQVSLKNKGAKDKFHELILKLSKEKKVVILIDEYDKPLTDYITDIPKADKNREILREFFGVLKPMGDKIEMLFITGIARFSKVSLFSVLNNLTDITFSSDYAGLVGITQAELEANFSFYIERLSEAYDFSKVETLEALKKMYNGYSWDGKTFVYNPFSLMNAFREMDFENFWFSTGTPKFLIETMKEQQLTGKELEEKVVLRDFFEIFDITKKTAVVPLLFQTGYLTIKKTWREGYRKLYQVDYPNLEVKEAFLRNIYEVYTEKEGATIFVISQKIKRAFNEKDIKTIRSQFNILLSDISYHLFPFEKKEADAIRKQREFIAWEGYFHTIVYIVLQYIGINIQCEVTKKGGRLDAIIEVEKYLYIIEFNPDSYREDDAKAALAQIKEKDYAHSYQNTNKEVILMGVAFDRDKKEVMPIEWEVLKK